MEIRTDSLKDLVAAGQLDQAAAELARAGRVILAGGEVQVSGPEGLVVLRDMDHYRDWLATHFQAILRY